MNVEKDLRWSKGEFVEVLYSAVILNYKISILSNQGSLLFVGVDGCFRGMAALHACKYTCGQSPEAHVDNLSIIDKKHIAK